MRNWPVSAKQRPLFNELCDRRTHMVQPLPAYDVDHKLIDPCLYERELRGAIVEVHFTLEHFRFAFDLCCDNSRTNRPPDARSYSGNPQPKAVQQYQAFGQPFLCE